MTRMTRLAATALAAVAILPAASAQAAPANGAADVAQHLKKATTATAKLTKHVDAGRDAQALKLLKTARRETTTAARDARRLANRASGGTAVERAIWALAASGAAQARAASDYAALLDDAGGSLQTALANALPSSLASRDAVIASLTALIQRIEDPELQALASQALAALAAQTPVTLDELAAIGVEELPTRVAAIIQTALQAATQAIDLVTQQLTALIPGLPAQALAPVTQALTMVGQLVTGLTATVTPSLPSLGGLLPDLSSIVPGFGGLLDGLLGGLPVIGALLGGR